ncbi:MAG: glycosyltransferase family 4 protein [Nitrososphaeria archaeon]
MKVLLISGEYPPHMFGGGATFMYHLSKGLVNKGTEVTVVAMKFSKSLSREVSVDVLDSRLKVLRVSVPVFLYPRHEIFQVVAKLLISKLIKEHDVVHMNTGLYYPFLRDVIKSSRKPTVVTIHGDPILIYKPLLNLCFSPIELLYGLLHMSERHASLKKELGELFPVFVSKSLYETMKSKYEITNYSIIYNGLNFNYIDKVINSNPKTDFYRMVMNMKECGYKILVYPARLHPIKNHFTLIRILRLLINRYNFKVLLILIGDGISKASIINQTHKMNVSKYILMTGKLHYEDTLKILALADVVPFVSLYEAHPLSMVEALYLGKPIVSFSLPYAREIRALVPKGIIITSSLKEFAEAIANTLNFSETNNLTYRKTLVKEIQRTFNEKSMVRRYLDLYEKLITKG